MRNKSSYSSKKITSAKQQSFISTAGFWWHINVNGSSVVTTADALAFLNCDIRKQLLFWISDFIKFMAETKAAFVQPKSIKLRSSFILDTEIWVAATAFKCVDKFSDLFISSIKNS